MIFDRLKQLGKDSIIYGIGGVLAKSVSFFLLPIYTRIFTPAEYGTIEMLTVISSLLGTVLLLGMSSAQSMYFFKYKKEGRVAQARVVSSILQLRLIWGFAIILIATVSAPLINVVLFNGRLSWEYFAIAFGGTLFTQIMSQSAEVMRLLYRPWGYIMISLAHSLVAAGLILLFILVFEQSILGFFLGTAVASVLVSLLGWFQIRDYIVFDKIHWDLWPQLIRFGAPLLPAAFAMYFMNTTDRWFVLYYHGEQALGLFAIGAKFAMLMALTVEVFRKAWFPIAMDAMHSHDGPETFRLIARLYVSIGICAVIILTLLSPWLVKWLTAPEFHETWPLVGILAWQGLFYGFFSIASAGIWKAEKTYLNLYMMLATAVLGLLLNWALVPSFGGLGAALATVITFLVWTVASMVVSERLWLISFPVKVFAFQLLLGGSLIAWLVLTDFMSVVLLKWFTALVVCTIVISQTLLPEAFVRLRKSLGS